MAEAIETSQLFEATDALVEGVRTAALDRDLTARAARLMVTRFDCTSTQAYSMLRTAAADQSLTLGEVATSIVNSC